MEDADRWLLSLRTQPREDVHAHLVSFCGIGPKVADCIALSSLDQYETIPVG
jgi:N-glycosylase/DNA lyase